MIGCDCYQSNRIASQFITLVNYSQSQENIIYSIANQHLDSEAITNQGLVAGLSFRSGALRGLRLSLTELSAV